MESMDQNHEHHWFWLFRRISRASRTAKVMIAIIVVAVVADVILEFGHPNQAKQLVLRAMIAGICIWVLTEKTGPNQSSNPTLLSGTSRGEHDPRLP